MKKKKITGAGPINRNYKDTVFCMLFKDRERLLGLYNTVSGRNYAKDMTIEEAVERAVEESIRQDILKELLLQNETEVKKMSIYEYDEETDVNVLEQWLRIAVRVKSIGKFSETTENFLL